ncbi:MAG: hypothetical protein WAW41_02035 [Methylobacter sp.]
MTAKKLPPFGKELNARLRFGNHPFLVYVCIGVDAWTTAKKCQQIQDNAALVLPAGEAPEKFTWPVRNCRCVIEWSTGPKADLIVRLIQCLIFESANTVIVWPTFVDHSKPSHLYDVNDRTWHRVREEIRTYDNNGTNNVY